MDPTAVTEPFGDAGPAPDDTLPTVVQAQPTMQFQLGNWEGMGVFADGIGRSFIDGLFDPGTGLTYDATQKGGTTEATVRMFFGPRLVDQRDVPLPNVRSNGFDIVVMHDTGEASSPLGIYLAMTDHSTPVPAAAHRLRLADWVGVTGGPPPPPPEPGPGPGGVTRDEVAQMISDALANFHPGGQPVTQADADLIVSKWAERVGRGGDSANRAAYFNSMAAGLAALGQLQVLTTALFRAGGDFGVWNQLNNTSFAGAREAIYSTGLVPRPPQPESAEPLAETFSPQVLSSADIAELLEATPKEFRPVIAALLGTTYQPSGETNTNADELAAGPHGDA